MIERFGRSGLHGPADEWFVYAYTMRGGTWVMFAFIPIGRALQIVAVRFDFDPDGVIRAAHVEKEPPSKPSLLTSVPERPRMLRELPHPATSQAATH